MKKFIIGIAIMLIVAYFTAHFFPSTERDFYVRELYIFLYHLSCILGLWAVVNYALGDVPSWNTGYFTIMGLCTGFVIGIIIGGEEASLLLMYVVVFFGGLLMGKILQQLKHQKASI